MQGSIDQFTKFFYRPLANQNAPTDNEGRGLVKIKLAGKRDIFFDARAMYFVVEFTDKAWNIQA